MCAPAGCVGDSTTPPADASTDATSQDAPIDQSQPPVDAPSDVQEAGPFDANFYGNLELWLSADVGVTAGDAGGIATWQDRSSKARVVSAPVSDPDCSQAPTLVPSAIHGLATVQFNGGTQCMTVSGTFSDFTLGFTAFAVIQPGNCNSQFLGNAAGVFDSSDNTSFNHSDPIAVGRFYDVSTAQVASGDGAIFSGQGYSAITGSASWVPATPELLELRLPAAPGGSLVTATAWVNGTFQNNVSQNNTTIPSINSSRTTTYIGNHASKTTGGYALYCGMIGELLIYSKALVDADRQAVEAHLKTRWGL